MCTFGGEMCTFGGEMCTLVGKCAFLVGKCALLVDIFPFRYGEMSTPASIPDMRNSLRSSRHIHIPSLASGRFYEGAYSQNPHAYSADNITCYQKRISESRKGSVNTLAILHSEMATGEDAPPPLYTVSRILPHPIRKHTFPHMQTLFTSTSLVYNITRREALPSRHRENSRHIRTILIHDSRNAGGQTPPP